MTTSVQDLTIPISLILAANILVIAVTLLFQDANQLWLFVMGFASIEVLIGSALWFVHDRA